MSLTLDPAIAAHLDHKPTHAHLRKTDIHKLSDGRMVARAHYTLGWPDPSAQPHHQPKTIIVPAASPHVGANLEVTVDFPTVAVPPGDPENPRLGRLAESPHAGGADPIKAPPIEEFAEIVWSE